MPITSSCCFSVKSLHNMIKPGWGSILTGEHPGLAYIIKSFIANHLFYKIHNTGKCKYRDSMFICYCLCNHIERIKNEIESAIILSDWKHSPKWFCNMPTFWKLLLRMQIVSMLEIGLFGLTPSCNSEHTIPMLCIWIIIYNYGQSEKQHYIMICDNKCGIMYVYLKEVMFTRVK